jgi:hypothetical protein
VVLRRIRLRRPEAFREADEHDPHGRGSEVEVVGEARVREPERREAALDLAHDGHAVLVQAEELDGENPGEDGDERAGNDRRHLLQPDDEDEGEAADQQGEAARVAEVAEQVPELLEEVALGLLDTEELRHLADDDRQRQPDDEPLEDRLGDEAREEAEPEDSCKEGEDSGHEGERDRQLEEVVGAGGRQVGHRCGGQRRSGRHRAGDEVPRAAECRVEQQGARGRVEADDRGDAGDRRVRERLRDEHGHTVNPATTSPRSQLRS